jgi:hypothetical protein
LLAEEEPLLHVAAFFIPLEPPLQQAARHVGRARPTVLTPFPDLVPELVYELVLLRRRR